MRLTSSWVCNQTRHTSYAEKAHLALASRNCRSGQSFTFNYCKLEPQLAPPLPCLTVAAYLKKLTSVRAQILGLVPPLKPGISSTKSRAIKTKSKTLNYFLMTFLNRKKLKILFFWKSFKDKETESNLANMFRF